jgi:hypothetical protein
MMISLGGPQGNQSHAIRLWGDKMSSPGPQLIVWTSRRRLIGRDDLADTGPPVTHLQREIQGFRIR